MDKIWMVRAYFEEYDSASWKILGLFTDRGVAEEIEKKWSDFYTENINIFDKPKDLIDDDDWEWSDEYFRLSSKYADIKNFRDIEIEEYPLNIDMSLTYENRISPELNGLMMQWDRDHKLGKALE